MKLPIVSRKKYERLEELFDIQVKNNEKLNEARISANNDLIDFQKQILEMLPVKHNIKLLDDIKTNFSEQAEKIKEQKKEISRFKSLLIRNGISYKKAEKK